MTKRKGTSTGIDDAKVIWTTQMDDVLIDAYAHQNNIDNRVGGTFTSTTYDSILNELRKKFPDINFDKEKIKNHIKYLKKDFSSCYDIFKNGLSGFTWNSATSTWCDEPEVWEKLLEANPDVKPWMTKPIRNYQKLASLYGKDRATGNKAETPREVKERLAQLNEQVVGKDDEGGNTIEEIDILISQYKATLEAYNLENEEAIQGTVSNKKQKTKKLKDDDVIILKESFNSVVEAIKESTAQLVKSNQRLQIPKNEIWNQLEELQLHEDVMNDTYLYLTRNPPELGAFLGCPIQARKVILLKMLQNAKNAS